MKTAKRLVARSSPSTRAPLRLLAAERDAHAGALFEGQVIAVDGQGVVRAVLASGARIEALAPAHVDRAWLREAVTCGPVEAVFAVTRPSGRHVLWGLFPGAAHADVRADLVVRGRHVHVDAESLHLTSRGAQLKLDPDGNASLRGRDLTSHARRVNRIKGGSIRLN